ncbi:hypothetical protein CR983_00085 [Candidatus Saccharibacteria bacterium]|nr:MAG: hypothetical protein CR983_00085 [Candidatus Saccharibacteria bacterium]
MMGSLAQKCKSLLGKKSARNSLWIISEQTFSIGATGVLMIIAARYLGAEQYGVFSYGQTLVILFGAIAKVGIDSIIVNELIRNKNEQGLILGTSLALRLASSLLSIILMLILLLLLNGNQPLLIVVAMIQSLFLLFQSGYVFDFWFQSKLESRYASIAKTVATLFAASYGIFVLLNGLGVLWFAWMNVVMGGLTAILLLILYKQRDGRPLAFSSQRAKSLLSDSYHFMIAGITAVIYVQVDKVMIGNIENNTQLGYYAAALTLCAAWSFLPNAITQSMRPVILEAKLASEALYTLRLKQLFFIVFWLSAFVSALIAIAAPWIVSTLYGQSYAPSILIIQIAVWYMPLSMLGTARGVWIVAEQKNKYVKYYLAVGLIINVVLNLYLIPRFGIIGAAVATIITELITGFFAPLCFSATRMYPKLALQALMYRV